MERTSNVTFASGTAARSSQLVSRQAATRIFDSQLALDRSILQASESNKQNNHNAQTASGNFTSGVSAKDLLCAEIGPKFDFLRHRPTSLPGVLRGAAETGGCRRTAFRGGPSGPTERQELV